MQRESERTIIIIISAIHSFSLILSFLTYIQKGFYRSKSVLCLQNFIGEHDTRVCRGAKIKLTGSEKRDNELKRNEKKKL